VEAVNDNPFKPGDPPPEGYLNWHAWAEVQDKAGLRQKQCSRCGLWKFPQELSGPACLKCAAGVPVLRAALDEAARALFTIKRMKPDAVPEFAAEAHRKACVALDAAGVIASDASRVQRLRDAIEGECDGMAIDERHARAILEYVDGVAPTGEAQRLAMGACRLLCVAAVVQENPDKVVCPPAFLVAVRAAMLALRADGVAAVAPPNIEQAIAGLDYFLMVKEERRFVEGARAALAGVGASDHKTKGPAG
jgi:hypothetical protein